MKTIIKILLFIIIFSPAILLSKAGDLDSSFGNNGIVKTSAQTGRSSRANAIILVDGCQNTIIGGRNESTQGNQFLLIKYKNNGSLDQNFGLNKNGIVITPNTQNRNQEIINLAQDYNKNIIAAGLNTDFSQPVGPVLLAKYNSIGILDKTFGTSGQIIIDKLVANLQQSNLPLFLPDLAIQPDNKILVFANARGSQAQGGQASIVRLLPNGTYDQTFGNNGVVLVPHLLSINSVEQAAKIVLQNGKIIALLNTSSNFNAFSSFAVVRYNIDGSLDKTFAGNGKIIIKSTGNNNYVGTSLYVLSDGSVLVGGIITNFAATKFIIVKLTPNGQIDNTFGQNGYIITNNFGSSDSNYLTSLQVQPDGKIIASGYAASSMGSKFLLARFNSNGTLDKTFANNGYVITTISRNALSSDSVLQQDGKIILAGYSGNGLTQVTLARYLNDSSCSQTTDLFLNALRAKYTPC